MMFAQVAYLCLLVLALGIRVAETANGHKSGRDLAVTLITFAGQIMLLYCGGFFRWL